MTLKDYIRDIDMARSASLRAMRHANQKEVQERLIQAADKLNDALLIFAELDYLNCDPSGATGVTR